MKWRLNFWRSTISFVWVNWIELLIKKKRRRRRRRRRKMVWVEIGSKAWGRRVERCEKGGKGSKWKGLLSECLHSQQPIAFSHLTQTLLHPSYHTPFHTTSHLFPPTFHRQTPHTQTNPLHSLFSFFISPILDVNTFSINQLTFISIFHPSHIFQT